MEIKNEKFKYCVQIAFINVIIDDSSINQS